MKTVVKEYRETMLEYREKFLDMSSPLVKDFGGTYYVYAIINKIDHKKYIGKTKNIYDRANAYIRVYLNEKKKYRERKIDKAIKDYGIDNFTMIPLIRCQTDNALARYEFETIKFFRATDPEYGYNVKDHIDYSIGNLCGYSPSIETRILKGKMVAAIHPEKKLAFICVGGRIFGDYIGTSKDMIKNTNRRGSTYKGWYVIYLDEDERIPIYEKKMSVKESSAHKFKDNHKKYHDMVELTAIFAKNPDPKIFTDQGYTLNFLTYNPDEHDSQTYLIEPIENFFKYIS